MNYHSPRWGHKFISCGLAFGRINFIFIIINYSPSFARAWQRQPSFAVERTHKLFFAFSHHSFWRLHLISGQKWQNYDRRNDSVQQMPKIESLGNQISLLGPEWPKRVNIGATNSFCRFMKFEWAISGRKIQELIHRCVEKLREKNQMILNRKREWLNRRRRRHENHNE